eukprot:TRINITY_DN49267_c0_g1_i1.p1 TRINITY_DN49267_c0_g1~~TRINITY_DN49267_c0_g1_i1.p1  ORF type:complete len:470 (-),score=51.92 TRINITY_DN49267_c0_g1_i1:118-1527(-)
MSTSSGEERSHTVWLPVRHVKPSPDVWLHMKVVCKCDPVEGPDTSTIDSIREQTLRASDAVVIISAATGVPALKYEAPAKFLVHRGGGGGVLTVVLWDYTAMGKSTQFIDEGRPSSEFLAAYVDETRAPKDGMDLLGTDEKWKHRSKTVSFDTWRQDLEHVIDWIFSAISSSSDDAKRKHPIEIVHIGHSLGSHIFPLCSNAASCVSRAISISAQSAYFGYAPGLFAGPSSSKSSSPSGKNRERADKSISPGKIQNAKRDGYGKMSWQQYYFFWRVMAPAVTYWRGYFPAKEFGLAATFLPRDAFLQWKDWSLTSGYCCDPSKYGKFEAPVLCIFADDDEFIRVGKDALQKWLISSTGQRQNSSAGDMTETNGPDIRLVDAPLDLSVQDKLLPPEILEIHRPYGSWRKGRVRVRILHSKSADAIGHNGWLDRKRMEKPLWEELRRFALFGGGNDAAFSGSGAPTTRSRL